MELLRERGEERGHGHQAEAEEELDRISDLGIRISDLGIRISDLGSAFAGFLEGDLGSIEPGKLADIAVTNENPFEVEQASLKNVTTWMTLLGGEIVWK